MAKVSAPDDLQARLTRALDAHRAGDSATAIDGYRYVLSYRPDLGDVWRLAGLAYAAASNAADAINCLVRAVSFNPGERSSYAALSALLLDLDAVKLARRAGSNAIALDQTQDDARNNLGNALRRLGDPGLASISHAMAICLAPANRLAWLNLGVDCRALELPGSAAIAYGRALALQPDWIEALQNLANVSQILGDRTRAREVLARLGRNTGKTHYALKRALVLPIVATDIAEIDAARAELDLAIKRADADGIKLDDPLTEIGQTAFYLSYHDRDDRPLQEALAQLYLKACPSLGNSAPHIAHWRGPKGRRLRVAIISEHLRAHTIGRLNQGMIAQLDRQRFEVVVVRPDGPDDPIRRAIGHSADQTLALPDTLDAARRAISAIEADLIYYPDIGMAPLTFFLAFARLAPVQAVGWGHPDTTGIANLDLFVSCDAMEPAGAEDHYSEKLARLPGPTLAYALPEPVAALTRSDFGLPERGPIFLCPQTPQKLHPDFDVIIQRLLRAEPSSHFVLVHGLDPFVGAKLVTRITRDAPDIAPRVHMFAAMPKARYTALIGVCDVMLDPFHYSGGHTSLEAIAQGAPLVTWPGRFMRGRHTAGFLQLMGMADQWASDSDDYVARALTLSREADARAAFRSAYAHGQSAIFSAKDALAPIEQAFEQAIERARQSR